MGLGIVRDCKVDIVRTIPRERECMWDVGTKQYVGMVTGENL